MVLGVRTVVGVPGQADALVVAAPLGGVYALERLDEYGNSFNKKSDGVEKRGHCGLVGEHPGIDDSHGNANECRCRADEICRQRAAVFVVKIILGEGFKAVFCYVI